MTEKKNPLGPTGERVRANVQRIRTGDRISYRELSDRLEAVGRPIPTLGLSRLENGDRRVDTDDLVALAWVLGVNPNQLLLPPSTASADGEIELTPEVHVPIGKAWTWAAGSQAWPDAAIGEIAANRTQLAPIFETIQAAIEAGVETRIAVAAAYFATQGIRLRTDGEASDASR